MKAIIFFSFWQSVVVALLVFAGIIPEGKEKKKKKIGSCRSFTHLFYIYLAEHISVAIQDFLVCIEMVPFAIAHS